MCSAETLVEERYSDVFKHNGGELRVDQLEGARCTTCNSEPTFPEQSRANQLRIADARRSADGLLTAAEIKGIRDRFGLTQADASLLFGGGPLAFSKYERGENIQSVPMDRLLRAAVFKPAILRYIATDIVRSHLLARKLGAYVEVATTEIVDAANSEFSNVRIFGARTLSRQDWAA
jgi:putative zinc finger/helix-turn-helix YgiT family protein